MPHLPPGPTPATLLPMFVHLAVWLHDIDPYAIKLWDGGPIRWYGLSYLLGFAIAYLLIRRVARVGNNSMPAKRVADLVVALAIGIVIGGRLGYVFFYRPALLWDFSAAVPFWGVLAINKGGMASHGGMIGGIVAAVLFARRHQQPIMHLLDLLAFATPLGLFFGRIANFVNGELFGRPCDPDFPLAVKFPQELADWTADELNYLAGQLKLDAVSYDSLISHVLDRIQAGDQLIINTVQPLLTPRHPSQLYAAVLEGLVVFAILLFAWRRPRKPGTIGGLFCISYALMRIVNECFRMPDTHLLNCEFAVFGITRGQWLSVLLFIFGLIILWFAQSARTSPMGGYLHTDMQ